MTYVAAGVVSVLALAAAAVSWIFAPVYQARTGGADGGLSAPAPAPTSPEHLRDVPKSCWIIFAILAALAGMGAWSVWSGGAAAPALVRHAAALLLLLSAALFDYRTHLIPNFLVIAMLLSGAVILGGEFLFDRSGFAAALLSAAGGLIICFPVFCLLSLLTRSGLGMGDVKLISAMAWLLGLSVALASVLFGLVLCTLAAIGLMLTKKKSKTDFIPFGPFIFAGYILLLLFFRV